MGLFSSINIAASGLTAQRTRLDVIADNMANVNTTRTADGAPFQRSRVVFRPRVNQPYWRSPFLPDSMDHGVGTGVRISKIEKDTSPPRLVYDPTHPDALLTGPRAGYVAYPNVNVVDEMVDMMAASRSYEANVAIIEGTTAMYQRALEIGR